MPLKSEQKKEIAADYQHHPTDTGSAEVQVALLTARINQLTDHLKTHRRDHHSRRGLFVMIGKRRRLLSYLSTRDAQRYRALIQRLGLRDVVGVRR